MKITNIGSREIGFIAQEMERELKALGERLGVEIAYKGGRYGGLNGEVKLEVAVVGATGKAIETADEAAFRLNAWAWGLMKDDLGREFVTSQGRYRIIGAKPRATKYPILGECVMTGRRYKFPPATVQNGIRRAA